MENVVPPSLLFDFRPRLLSCGGPSSKRTGSLLALKENATVYPPASVNDSPRFATIRLGWNETGFGGCVTVAGKTGAPQGDVSKLDATDSVTVWIDTRPSGIVHRATEYCHCFGFVPAEGDGGKPAAVVVPIAQQRATRVESNVKLFQLRTKTGKSGQYTFEFWIPGTQLHGFREISEFGRLGFHTVINDRELGQQSFSLADDFPTSYDPSTWTQLELQT